MAIYNFDKSQQFSNLHQRPDMRPENYQQNPMQSTYNHNNPDIATAERIVLENLRVSGAWVTVMIRTDDNKFNATWSEDQSPTYHTGYDFKAFVVPQPPEIMLTKFGHDSPNKLELKFSRAEVLETIGDRLIRIGDIISMPHNSLVIKAEKFRAIHVSDEGNYKYRWLYLNVIAENINKDESFMPRNN